MKNEIYINGNKLETCINCTWNELLILKNKNKDFNTPSDIKTFDKIGVKVPAIGTDVYHNGKRLIINQYCFSEFGFIDKYPKVVYMKIKNSSELNVIQGDPIYCSQDKLLGIVSFINGNNIYCLPSYYLIKTFEKENSFKIPTVDERITRINRNIVKGGLIFNPYLGINIPLSSFLILEENRNLESYGEKDDDKPIEVKYREFKKLPILENKRSLTRDSNGYYNLSSASLHLMKVMFPEYLKKMNKIINNNSDINKLKFKIDKKNLKVCYSK